MFVILIKNKSLFRGIFYNAIFGLTTLTILKLLEQLTLIKIYINYIWVLSAVTIGPVGVVLNLIIDYIFIK